MTAVTAEPASPGVIGRALAACTAAVAVATGWVTGRALASYRTLPGLAGAAMVAYGTSMVYLPAGVIAGGLFLLLLDRRL